MYTFFSNIIHCIDNRKYYKDTESPLMINQIISISFTGNTHLLYDFQIVLGLINIFVFVDSTFLCNKSKDPVERITK